MTYEYTVLVSPSPGAAHAKDHRQCHVLVEPLQGEQFRVVIDGVETLVSARKVEAAGAAASYSLIQAGPGQAGTQRMVDVDPLGAAGAVSDDLRVTVNGGEPLFVQVHDLRDRLIAGDEQGGGGAAGELRAAMPGKVVKLLSKAGDTVKAGQSLLVIEAMKMENELRSPSAGRITEIAVREGQTVEAGQLLVALSP
ncbi:MAG TPA: biotin/lipoyl-binding protein [Pseudomonadota bacterium]|nr:biotin/lipoyl-binding protein [Pseudomonadota bacterium]